MNTRTQKDQHHSQPSPQSKDQRPGNGNRGHSTATAAYMKPNNGANDKSQTVKSLLDNMRELIDQSGPDNPVFGQKLAELQKAVRKQELQELSSPINNWTDLKVRTVQLKRASKRGDFDLNLKIGGQNLHKYLSNVNPHEELEYWKARTLLYELNDVFQIDPEIDKKAFEDGFAVSGELAELERTWEQDPKLPDSQVSESYRRLLREKVLFCCCRGDEMKRRGDSVGAGKLFGDLLRFTERNLNTDDTPCFGTRAYLSYNLGTIHRVLEDHDLAKEMYTKALNLYRERSKNRSRDDQDDFFFTTRRIAMCIGLGFGWVSLTRGHLHRAENALTTARAMLARIPDSLVAHYIEMLYGSIKRCRAGKDQEKLIEAIKSLDAAYRAFEDRGHKRYGAHAARELALAFNLTGQSDKALFYLKITEDWARQEGSLKGQANAHALRSRIYRNQGDYVEALNESQTALEMARECKEILPQVDALISRGEANFYLAANTQQQEGKYAEARGDFEEAQEMLRETTGDELDDSQPLNPKLAAVCELRIAQCYAGDGDEREAEIHFLTWEVLRASVEHKWVRELAREVRAQINKLKRNFAIPSNDASKWNYFENARAMQRWLKRRALEYAKGDRDEAARLLGVTKSAMHQWDHKTEVRRTRTRKVRQPID